MRTIRLMFWALLVLAAIGRPASAGADSPLSIEALAEALRTDGFQAVVLPAPPSGGGIKGAIRSGVAGSTVLVVSTGCTDDPDGVCSLIFTAIYADTKNRINDETLAALNGKLTFARATSSVGKDGAKGLMITYAYLCKGISDPKVVSMVMREFGTDLGRASALYNSGFSGI